MKSFKILFNSLLLILPFCSTNVFATNPPPPAQIISQASGNGTFQFNIDLLPHDVTNAFWILGDGHFRTGLSPQHNMKKAFSVVQAYMLKPYRTTPPSKLICGGCTSSDVSPLPNYTVAFGSNQSVQVGTSWNPTRGQKHYTILTYTNTTGHTDGKVKINFDYNIQNLEVYSFENNQNWYSNLTIDNVDNVIEFEFNGLQQNHQRHLLIETTLVANPVASNLNYTLTMYSNFGDVIYTSSPTSEIKKYPHDPNLKSVSEPTICAYNNQTVNLEYRIDFQNIGDFYAMEVIIEDYLPPHLDYNSFQFISSSHSCQVTRNNNFVQFLFEEIELPGLDQTMPHIPHPNDTQGHVIFSVETEKCLDEMVIENEAIVFFDNLDPIYTPLAQTEVIYNDFCFVTNQSCDDVNDDGTNDDGTNDDGNPPPTGLTTGTDEVAIYPNPFDLSFSIDLKLENEWTSESELAVYNIQGVKVMELSHLIQGDTDFQQIRIDASNWSKGVYFVKLENTNAMRSWKIAKL